MILKFKRTTKSLFIAVLSLTAFSYITSCSDAYIAAHTLSEQEDASLVQFGPEDYFTTARKLVFHIYHEHDATPLTGEFKNGTPVWEVTQSNLTELTADHHLEIDLPGDDILNPKFTLIEDQEDVSWSVEDIYQLALNYATDNVGTAEEPGFQIFFLNGFLEDEFGKTVESVIGVSLSISSKTDPRPTPLIAIFKDVIDASSTDENDRKLMEQSTLIHEIGHSLGLVNMDGGVAMHTPHEDPDHENHCDNDKCLMYWANESINDRRPWDYFFSDPIEDIFFCENCKADIKNYQSSK